MTPGETPNSGTRLGSTPPVVAVVTATGGAGSVQGRGAAVALKSTKAERAMIVVNFIEVNRHEVGDGKWKWVQDRKIGFKD